MNGVIASVYRFKVKSKKYWLVLIFVMGFVDSKNKTTMLDLCLNILNVLQYFVHNLIVSCTMYMQD